MRALEVSPLIDLCFCKMCDLSYRVTLLTFQNCLLQNIASSEVAGVRIKEGFTWFHYGLLGELQMCCRFQTVMEQNRAAHWLLRGRQDLHLTQRSGHFSPDLCDLDSNTSQYGQLILANQWRYRCAVHGAAQLTKPVLTSEGWRWEGSFYIYGNIYGDVPAFAQWGMIW